MIQSSHRAYGSGRITSIGFTETSEAVKQITLSVPTETMDNLSETYQNTLPEIQVNPCRAHQKTKQIHAGTLRFHQIHADSIRFPPKSIHNQSESQQNHAESIRTSTKIHQNLNNTYAEQIRTSTKTHQNPLELQQKSIRISTIPMQNPSELQQKSIRILTIPMHNPLPQPGSSVQTTFRLRRTAARFRLLVPESIDSYSHSAAVCIQANQQIHFHRMAGPPANR